MPTMTIIHATPKARSGGFLDSVEIDTIDIDTLQTLVGGYIEIAAFEIGGQSCSIIVNEDGIALGLQYNMIATGIYHHSKLYGTVLLFAMPKGALQRIITARGESHKHVN